MGTRGGTFRVPSHQLSSGLYVSGRPEQQHKEKAVTSSAPMPYTGGNVKKSGELGKMFEIPSPEAIRKSGNFGNISSASGLSSRPSYSTSGPQIMSSGPSRQSSASGAQNRSGPLMGNILGGGARLASHSGCLSKSGDLGNATTSSIATNLKTSGLSFSCRAKLVKCITSVSLASLSTKSKGPLSGGGGPPTIGRQNSGNLLPATGLITSGPISSGPLSSSGAPKKKASGPLDSAGAPSKYVNPAINKLVHEGSTLTEGIPKVVLWTVVPLFVVGFVAAGFIYATVKNSILLIVVGSICAMVVMFLMWNSCWGGKSTVHFLASYDDVDLRHAKDGQYVKVTGVVTCGSVPLESSYQKVNRCIYTSTALYEYRGLKSKEARKGHRRFTWGLRNLERHVADFYISDFQSGLRALVKAGYTAAVLPLVEDSTVLDISLNNREVPNNFLRWVGEHNLSVEDRMMRLKEGYIKEGSTVTVMGVVQRHDNMLMMVPPREVISTGCQWKRLLLPKSIHGLILCCDEAVGTMDALPL